MPQLKPKIRKQATAKDVKSAAAVGNAQYEYFQKYGEFPKSDEELNEFLL